MEFQAAQYVKKMMWFFFALKYVYFLLQHL